MKRAVECLTQADVDRVTANGDIAIVRSGRFEARGSSHVVAWGSYPNKVKAPRVVGKGCVEVDERGAVIEAAAS